METVPPVMTDEFRRDMFVYHLMQPVYDPVSAYWAQRYQPIEDEP